MKKKKEVMIKKGKVKKLELPKISFDVSDDGDVVSISCKTFVKYHMTIGKLWS